MKLHEMKQKRNTIAKDMRALHDKIGDTPWTDEQRTQWNAAKSELDALDERIAREEELRRQDQDYIHENEPEQRQQQNRDPANPEAQANERRAAAFNAFLRRGLGEMSAEERQALKELRAQGTTPDEKGGYTVPTQFRNKIVEALKDYGGIASVAQILNTANGQEIDWQPLTVPLKKVNCWAKTLKPVKKTCLSAVQRWGLKNCPLKSFAYPMNCCRTAA